MYTYEAVEVAVPVGVVQPEHDYKKEGEKRREKVDEIRGIELPRRRGSGSGLKGDTEKEGKTKIVPLPFAHGGLGEFLFDPYLFKFGEAFGGTREGGSCRTFFFSIREKEG